MFQLILRFLAGSTPLTAITALLRAFSSSTMSALRWSDDNWRQWEDQAFTEKYNYVLCLFSIPFLTLYLHFCLTVIITMSSEKQPQLFRDQVAKLEPVMDIFGYFLLMWITVHLLTPKFHLHFISQSYSCCILSFSFIFPSANSSKHGKSKTQHKHYPERWPVAPSLQCNALMLFCQATSYKPKACLPSNPCCAGRERQKSNWARMDQNAGVYAYTASLPMWVDGQYTISEDFFPPQKCSGYSPSFVYKISTNPFICPEYHYVFTKQLMQSQIGIHT